MEAEAADLLDRTNIALYGGYQHSGKIEKLEVMNTSEKLKSIKGRAGSLFSPRIQPSIAFEAEKTPNKNNDTLPLISGKTFEQTAVKTLIHPS